MFSHIHIESPNGCRYLGVYRPVAFKHKDSTKNFEALPHEGSKWLNCGHKSPFYKTMCILFR